MVVVGWCKNVVDLGTASEPAVPWPSTENRRPITYCVFAHRIMDCASCTLYIVHRIATTKPMLSVPFLTWLTSMARDS